MILLHHCYRSRDHVFRWIPPAMFARLVFRMCSGQGTHPSAGRKEHLDHASRKDRIPHELKLPRRTQRHVRILCSIQLSSILGGPFQSAC